MIKIGTVERAFQRSMRALCESNPDRWHAVFNQIANTLPPVLVEQPEEGEPVEPVDMLALGVRLRSGPASLEQLAEQAERRRIIALLRSTDTDAHPGMRAPLPDVPAVIPVDGHRRAAPALTPGMRVIPGDG